ncbi:hypothetical protein HN51_015529, partial [Arachis hypogaea]
FTMSTSRPTHNFDAPASASAPVSASASAGHATETTARSVAVIRATRIDPGWKYVSAVEEKNTNDTICNFCGKIMRGGITRAKEHLMIKLGNVVGCKMVPKDEDAQGIDEIPNPTPMAAARGGASSIRGPMNLFMKGPETAIARNKKEKLRQQNIKEACNKEVVRRVHQYIARWFYQAGIPLNPVRLKSFQEMLWAVGSFGPNLPAPSYHALR